MKKNPKVSIVIPVYNGSNYLKEAIDSALNQTYKNLEIIVVNDGSKDNGATEKIAKSYGSKIRYFRKENGGVATALNYGIEKMTGDYFSWLSHDDIYYSNKIEVQINFLKQYQSEKPIIPYADFDLIDVDSKIIQTIKLDHELLDRKPEYSLLRGNINGLSLLISKEILDGEKELFDPNLKCTQDYDFWIRLSKKFKFVHMPKVIVKSRVHSLQDSNSHPNAIIEGNKLWISMMESISKKRKIELEGSIAAYYIGMHSHLSKSLYYEARDFALDEIEKEYSRLIESTPSDKRKISIIIPCFNNTKYLKKTIDSIKSQDYDNYEIIIVDDGSYKKSSISKLDKIVDSDIKLFRNKNMGVSEARNFGYQKSTGNFIQFLDSDDYLMPNKFKFQMAVLLSKDDIGIAYSSYSYYNQSESEYTSPELKVDLGENVIESLLYGWQRKYSIPIHSPLIRKSAFSPAKKPFEVNYKISEDWIMWIQLASRSKFYYIDEKLVVYRIWPESTTGNTLSRDSSLYWVSRAISYIAENYISESEINKFNIQQQKYIKYLASIYYTYDFSLGYRLQYQELLNKIHRIENSTSWRITKPIRLVGKFLRNTYQHGFLSTIKSSVRKILLKMIEALD